MDKEKQNQKINKPADDEDFTSSMARLAELAAKDLGPDKPKEDKTVEVDDELLKEFMRPKRKAKPQGWKEKWAGKTVKLNINPYVASGIAIIVLSVGIIAAPKIVKHFEEQRKAEDAEKQKIAMLAKNTEDKLKSYSVFDAAKDISGTDKDLKATSLTDLKKKVEEGNIAAAEKAAAEETSQLAMNTLSLQAEDVQFDLSMELNDSIGESGAANLNNTELYWDLPELNETVIEGFSSFQNCSEAKLELPSDEIIVSDILQSYLVFAGKNC